ncbi:MAG TPA: hypothetical protein EYH03_04465 [Chromatiales bacterium]|nr:hypothetical protein [Chromatiales bacterium]
MPDIGNFNPVHQVWPIAPAKKAPSRGERVNSTDKGNERRKPPQKRPDDDEPDDHHIDEYA